MYSLKSVLDKQPVAIAAAVIAVLNAFVIAGTVTLNAQSVSGINVALVAVLGLFVGNRTANKAVLNELADAGPPAKARAAKKQGGQSLVQVLVAVALILVIIVLLRTLGAV